MQTPGEILRAERERKGLSIKDVEQATSIRALYLNAIEEGKYSVVPGEVYLKGFIRNYAAYLGLNSQELVDLYRQTTQTAAGAPAGQSAPEKPKETSAPERKPSTSEKVKEEKSSSPSIKWAAIVAVPVLAAAGWWFTQMNSNTPSPNPPPKPAPTIPAQPAPVPAPQAQQPPVTPAPVHTKPVVVVVKFTDECWALVTADGKEVFEGIPKVGESFTWEAQQNITVKLGNASGVDLTYNGAPQGKLGAKGEVVTKTFTPKP